MALPQLQLVENFRNYFRMQCSLFHSGHMYCVSYVLRYFLRPLVSGSFLFGVSPEEYMIWIVWEMISGILSVCSALGSTYKVMESFTHVLRERELGS